MEQLTTRNGDADFQRIASTASGHRSRATSIDSRQSNAGSYAISTPPLGMSPDPVFIAPSAAAQIVTDGLMSQNDTWMEQNGVEPCGEVALVAPASLRLLNGFLDQLLLSILSAAGTTTLSALRPAVIEILRPKLAKDAIAGAEQELTEYLGDVDNEELLAAEGDDHKPSDWDLELVWKRTRLRCMVYSSLGDMEEEDEDDYAEQEHLFSGRGDPDRTVVSPAVAIFLTSIVEFVGEQALLSAGNMASSRIRAKYDRERDITSVDVADRVVVEEMDMEKIALDRTLGRLWRGWKKRVRTSGSSTAMAHSRSRDGWRSARDGLSRRTSITNEEVPEADEQQFSMALPEDEFAAGIPLPLTEDDVREIEIPGLRLHPDDEDWELVDPDVADSRRRPKSLMIVCRVVGGLVTPDISPRNAQHPSFGTRKRALSLPSPSSAAHPAKRLDSNDMLDTPMLISRHDFTRDSRDTTSSSTGFTQASSTRSQSQFSTALPSDADANVHPTRTGLPVAEAVTIGSNRTRMIRSFSGNSVRMVELAPKSPTLSRNASFDSSNPASRNSLVRQPETNNEMPRVMTPAERSQSASPMIRSGSGLSGRKVRISGSSMSEVSEVDEIIHQRDSLAVSDVEEIIRPRDSLAVSDVEEIMKRPDSLESYASLSSRSQLRPATNQLSVQATINQRNGDFDGQSQIMGLGEGSQGTPGLENMQSSLSTSTNNRSMMPKPLKLSAGTQYVYHGLGLHDDTVGAPPLTPLREMVEEAQDDRDNVSVEISNEDSDSFIYHDFAASKHMDKQTELNTLTSPSVSVRDELRSPRLLPSSLSNSSISPGPKLRPVRASDDAMTTRFGNGKSFDDLISSNQTIQYTLTPEVMRSAQSSDLSNLPTLQRFSSKGSRDSRNGPTSPRPGTSGSLTKMTGLYSNPVPESVRESKSNSPRQQSPAVMKRRAVQQQPRDARADRSSVGVFADFIRSTGPTVDVVAIAERANKQPASSQLTPVPFKNLSTTALPLANTAPAMKRSVSEANRLQAREAFIPRDQSSSELIDFIRQGPSQTSGLGSQARTQREFTLPTDQHGLISQVYLNRHPAEQSEFSQASRASTHLPSVHSSVTSHTALLASHTGNYAIGGVSQGRPSSQFDDEAPMPKRKTRRVRDPYAIDFSDEEDDFESSPVSRRPSQRREETLMDFLNNATPPPATTTEPFLMASDARSAASKTQKNASTRSLMTRFGKKDAVVNDGMASSTSQVAAHGLVSNRAPVIPHIPSPPRLAESTSPTHARGNYITQMQSERQPATQQRRTQPKLRTATSDLADFLMNTPPPPLPRSRTPSPGLQPEAGFRSMLGRTMKKLSAA